MSNFFGNYRRNKNILFYFWGKPKIVSKSNCIELINVIYFTSLSI